LCCSSLEPLCGEEPRTQNETTTTKNEARAKRRQQQGEAIALPNAPQTNSEFFGPNKNNFPAAERANEMAVDERYSKVKG
jgi:hypothetical protein